jgi:hypothetical protein
MEDGTFVGDTLPNFSDLFIGYEARIQAIFDRIVAASSVNRLSSAWKPTLKISRAKFYTF